MSEQRKKPSHAELVKNTRRYALEMLKLCDEAEEGRLTAEEFEKRSSKVQTHWTWGYA